MTSQSYDPLKPVLPGTVVLGMVRNQWPVYLFLDDASVTEWLRDAEPGFPRYAWRVTLTPTRELTLMRAEEYLVEREVGEVNEE